MKFKKGDLVEIIHVQQYTELLGVRFVLDTYCNYYNDITNKWESGWDVPIVTKCGTLTVCSEDKLKKINPDTDETSNFTFEELLGKLKTDQLEGVE